MPEYILVIDTGCSLIKTVIYDLNGLKVALTQTNLPFTYTPPNKYSRDLDEVWSTITSLIKETLKTSHISPQNIIAVTSVGYGNGLILLDDSGNPTYDAISNHDTRAKEIVDELHELGVAKRLRQHTIQNSWAGQTSMLLKWFELNEPEVLQRSSKILCCKDFSNYKLTGNFYSDQTDLSATNLYSVTNRCYDDQILDILELSDYKRLLPEDKRSTDICGYVTKKAETETSIPEGTPVITGLLDIVGSSLATGLVNTKNKENLILNVLAGTWAVDQYITTTPQYDNKAFSTRIHANSNHWLVSENGSTSTSNLDWYISNFLPIEKKKATEAGLSVFDFCDKALQTTKPEDSSIIFLPFIYGSNIDSGIKSGDELKATFFNLRMYDKQSHIIRSIYEGITFSHLYQINSLFTSTPQTLKIRLSGGGASSREWAQIFADTLQAPVETTRCNNANALGAAICASVGIGKYNTLENAAENMVYIKDRIEPNPYNKDIYEEKFFRYTSLIAKLSGTPKEYY